MYTCMYLLPINNSHLELFSSISTHDWQGPVEHLMAIAAANAGLTLPKASLSAAAAAANMGTHTAAPGAPMAGIFASQLAPGASCSYDMCLNLLHSCGMFLYITHKP